MESSILKIEKCNEATKSTLNDTNVSKVDQKNSNWFSIKPTKMIDIYEVNKNKSDNQCEEYSVSTGEFIISPEPKNK